jgi:hypothetical protein
MKLAAYWSVVQAIYAEGLAAGLAAFMTNPASQLKSDAGHLPFSRLVLRDSKTLLGWSDLTPVDNT